MTASRSAHDSHFTSLKMPIFAPIRSAGKSSAIRLDLEGRGEPIGMADSLIAGIVLAHDGILLTRNRAHFERVAGLNLSRGSE